MAPVLLDTRGLIRIASGLFILLMVIFLAGFISGYQKAASQQHGQRSRYVLALPASAGVSASKMGPHIPEHIAAGFDIDVDQPDLPVEQTNPELEHQTIAKQKINPVVMKTVMKTSAAARHNARYSVQVGVFRHRLNAQKQVKTLTQQGLNAYLLDYLNKRKQTRYNVRFGYYQQKKNALLALQQYRLNQQDHSGYLVKLMPVLHAENELPALHSGVY